MPVVFIDTGFLFPETLAFKDLVAERYDLHVVTIGPRGEPGPLYMTDKDACCTARKVEPMQRLLPDYDALVSGIRRDQSEARAVTDLIEYHDAEPHPIVKVHPLATWTRAEVWRYIADHDVPSHPLLDHGYTSIGCWPCTQPTLPGEAERAGRWRGSSKTECGLHTSLTTRRRTTGEP
jgi:phosphoadenosine phosphosulfate reductase